MRKTFIFSVVAASTIVPAAYAQEYPTRNIVLVSPLPAGGPSDTAARLVAGPMSKALG